MKKIFQPLLGLVLLVAFSFPAQAQNPAVRMTATGLSSVKFSLTNLSAGTISVGTVLLAIYDQKTCKRLCSGIVTLNKKLKQCETLSGEVKCGMPVPPGTNVIYWLRVTNTSGTKMTEDWLYGQ